MFQHLYLACEGFRGIVHTHGATLLQNDSALIILFIHIMNSDTAFFFSGRQYRFMYKMSVHTLATEFRQEGRMYINDAARKCLYEIGRNFPQEPCQYNQVGLSFLQGLHVSVAAEEQFLIDQYGRDLLPLRDLQNARIRFIGKDQRNPGQVRTFEMINDLPGITAGARCKNDDVFQAWRFNELQK